VEGMLMNILIADDEPEIIELVELYMMKDGIKVYKAENGAEALEVFDNEKIDLAIVDIMMPKVNGFELIKGLREKSQIPIIVLSARIDYTDKILGLDLGADDYITKPFNPLELVSRVKAQLRRSYEFNETSHAVDTIGNITIDRNQCTVIKAGEPVELTSTEYKILAYLTENKGRVLTKEQIFEAVWNEPYYGEENAVRVHISNLREKIEDEPQSPKVLKTIRGLGYRISGDS